MAATCSSCGADLRQGVRFCELCGTRVPMRDTPPPAPASTTPPVTSPPPAPPATPRRRSGARTGCLILLVIGVAYVAIALYSAIETGNLNF